jgi:hypothetical protein
MNEEKTRWDRIIKDIFRKTEIQNLLIELEEYSGLAM